MSHPCEDPVYVISIAAQLTGLHPQTLRLYERLGLVSPSRIGNKNRLFSEADVERLRQIRRFTQDMGVNLAGVEIILDLLQRLEELQSLVDHLERKIHESGSDR